MFRPNFSTENIVTFQADLSLENFCYFLRLSHILNSFFENKHLKYYDILEVYKKYNDNKYVNIVDHTKYGDENCIEDRYQILYT